MSDTFAAVSAACCSLAFLSSFVLAKGVSRIIMFIRRTVKGGKPPKAIPLPKAVNQGQGPTELPKPPLDSADWRVLSRGAVSGFVRCPKRLVLDRFLSEKDRVSMPEGSRLEQTQLRRLGQRWHRILRAGRGVNIAVIPYQDGVGFDEAVKKTRYAITSYLQDGKPGPLCVHDAAFCYTEKVKAQDGTVEEIKYRARIDVLHIDPLSTTHQVQTHFFKSFTELSAPRAKPLLIDIAYDKYVIERATEQWSSQAKAVLAASKLKGSSGGTLKVDRGYVAHLHKYVTGPYDMNVDPKTLAKLFVIISESKLLDMLGKKATTAVNAAGDTITSGPPAAAAEFTAASARLLVDPTPAEIELYHHTFGAKLHPHGSTKALQQSPKLPSDIPIGDHCVKPTNCRYFTAGYCVPDIAVPAPGSGAKQQEPTVCSIPNVAPRKKRQLWSGVSGPLIKDMGPKDVTEAGLSDTQTMYVENVRTGKWSPDVKAIETWVSELKYPLFFFDFEAAIFAIPPFERLKCHDKLPFQFAIDVFHEDIMTEKPKHHEFLYLGGDYARNSDPRRLLTDKFMRVIREAREISIAKTAVASATGKESIAGKAKKGSKLAKRKTDGEGTLIGHNVSFDRSILEKVMHQFPEYKAEIKGFNYADTLKLVRSANVLPPLAGGSFSLKKVLPELCPELSYGALAGSIKVGMEASDAYVRWYYGDFEDSKPAQIEALRQSLLEYTALDTRGMWELVRALVKKAGK